jgi:predicted Zn-ribbon and HTH transcriptional regulator
VTNSKRIRRLKMAQNESQEQDIEHVEVAAIEVNALEAMERATVDIQIATAKKYPRNIAKFVQKAKDMVSVDHETAVSCIYRRPVGKKGSVMEYAEGESIRLAEIVAACYGNLRVGYVITEMTPRYVKAIGVAHDLESNYAAKAETVESTVTRNGKPYSERMRVVVAKACGSKAYRDVVFRVVPKSLCKPIIEQCRAIALGEGLTMAQRRDRAAKWITILSIDADRVYAAIGVSGIEEMGENELLTLTGLKTAIKDGDIKIEEAFPADFDAANHKAVKEAKAKTGSVPVDTAMEETKSEPAEPEATEEFMEGADDPDTKAKVEKQKADLAAAEDAKGTGKLVCQPCGSTFDKKKQIKKGGRTWRGCPECNSKGVIDNPHYVNENAFEEPTE